MRKNDNNLYEKDFHKWALVQAENLKNRDWEKIDIENLVEEIECLGRSERAKLESFLTILLMHMLKVHYQPLRNGRSWDLSIKHAKRQINRIMEQNPSLKPQFMEAVNDAYSYARLEAAAQTQLEEDIFPTECPWSIKEILEEEK